MIGSRTHELIISVRNKCEVYTYNYMTYVAFPSSLPSNSSGVGNLNLN